MRAWIDMTLMSLTFFLTVIWSVQVGVTVSLIISLLLVVRRSSRTRMAILVGVSSIKQDVFCSDASGALGPYSRN
jgi:MFS superfamily sulfate permease-like transporter